MNPAEKRDSQDYPEENNISQFPTDYPGDNKKVVIEVSSFILGTVSLLAIYIVRSLQIVAQTTLFYLSILAILVTILAFTGMIISFFKHLAETKNQNLQTLNKNEKLFDELLDNLNNLNIRQEFSNSRFYTRVIDPCIQGTNQLTEALRFITQADASYNKDHEDKTKAIKLNFLAIHHLKETKKILISLEKSDEIKYYDNLISREDIIPSKTIPNIREHLADLFFSTESKYKQVNNDSFNSCLYRDAQNIAFDCINSFLLNKTSLLELIQNSKDDLERSILLRLNGPFPEQRESPKKTEAWITFIVTNLYILARMICEPVYGCVYREALDLAFITTMECMGLAYLFESDAPTCKKCGMEVSSTDSFCNNCGEKLIGFSCRECGINMRENSRHCEHCGAEQNEPQDDSQVR